MILNPDKYHYISLGKCAINDMLKFSDEESEAIKLETLSGIKTAHNLNFQYHIKTLYSKATKKLNNYRE